MFKGWIRTSLIDYPNHIATVLFTGGCDFRCPFCHNASLVLTHHGLPTIHLDEIEDFLSRRTGLVDGIVISGGEPTLHRDLFPTLEHIRSLGIDIKLDTNGYRPEILSELLKNQLVDYVAMDVKAPPDKYTRLTGMAYIDIQRLDRSIDLLRGSEIGYEFRTTIVPGLLNEDDIADIARWIEGATLYCLQQFRPQHTLVPNWGAILPHSQDTLSTFVHVATSWVKRVQVR